MRRFVGIAIFALAAAFSFYLHFNRVAKGYLERRVRVDRVSSGRLDVTVSGDRCSELARYEGRFVRITGSVKRVKEKEIEMGCLKIKFHTQKVPEVIPGDRLYLRGFVKFEKGQFVVDVWNTEFVKVVR